MDVSLENAEFPVCRNKSAAEGATRISAESLRQKDRVCNPPRRFSTAVSWAIACIRFSGAVLS